MKDFVVKTVDKVFGDFDTFAEAMVRWRAVIKRHPTAVIRDDTKR
jgi:hypothetical protein